MTRFTKGKEVPTASALPVPSRNTVQRGTGSGLTSGFGMSPGVSPIPMAVGRNDCANWIFKDFARTIIKVKQTLTIWDCLIRLWIF